MLTQPGDIAGLTLSVPGGLDDDRGLRSTDDIDEGIGPTLAFPQVGVAIPPLPVSALRIISVH